MNKKMLALKIAISFFQAFVITIFSFVIFRYSTRINWSMMGVIAGIIAATVLVSVGRLTKKKETSLACVSVGIVLYYISCILFFLALSLGYLEGSAFRLLPLIMLSTTSLSFLLALWYDSLIIYFLSFVGGFLALVAALGSLQYIALLAIVAFSFVVLSLRKNWVSVSVISSILMSSGLIVSSLAFHWMFGIIALALYILPLLFACIIILIIKKWIPWVLSMILFAFVYLIYHACFLNFLVMGRTRAIGPFNLKVFLFFLYFSIFVIVPYVYAFIKQKERLLEPFLIFSGGLNSSLYLAIILELGKTNYIKVLRYSSLSFGLTFLIMSILLFIRSKKNKILLFAIALLAMILFIISINPELYLKISWYFSILGKK